MWSPERVSLAVVTASFGPISALPGVRPGTVAPRNRLLM